MFLAVWWMACCGYSTALAATPYSISLGAEGEYSHERIIHDRQGNVYVAGTRLAVGMRGRLSLARITTDGQVDWFRTYDALLANSTVLAMDDKGDLLVGGEAVRLPIACTGEGSAFVAFVDAGTGDWKSARCLGGDGNVEALTTDANGNIYATGSTTSPAFPVSEGLRFGPVPRPNLPQPRSAAFLMKLSSGAEQRLFTAQWSGTGPVCATPSSCITTFAGTSTVGVVIDGSGNVVVAGNSATPDLPTTENALRRRGPGAYVAAFRPDGSGFAYFTYLSSATYSIPPIVLSAAAVSGMGVHPSGDVILAGSTFDRNFPLTAGAYQTQVMNSPVGYRYDGFVLRLKRDGSGVVWGTALGHSGEDRVRSASVDEFGRTWIAGTTDSPLFPRTEEWTPAGNGFTALISADGAQLLYSARFPHGSVAAAICAFGETAHTVGLTPFVISHAPWEPPRPAIWTAGSLSSLGQTQVAPGALIAVSGAWIGPPTAVSADMGVTQLPDELAGRRVLFDGIPAPLWRATTHEILVSVPFAMAGRDQVAVTVEVQGKLLAPVTVRIRPAMLELLRQPDGNAFFHPDGTPMSRRQIRPGDVITAWITGTGVAAGGDGEIGFTPHPYECCTVTVANTPARIVYSGSAPGLAAGVTQISFIAPEPGSQPREVRIRSGNSEVVSFLSYFPVF
ncbi:MAG: hypothetical protein JNL62_02930 [Bryobacterales bacterium]|nr:hypothetical protein [Bryobacterales bacterium]